MDRPPPDPGHHDEWPMLMAAAGQDWSPGTPPGVRGRFPLWLRALGVVGSVGVTGVVLFYTFALFELGGLLRAWLGPSFAQLLSLVGPLVVLPAVLLLFGLLGGLIALAVLWARGERLAPILGALIGLLLTLGLTLLLGTLPRGALFLTSALVVPSLVSWIRSALLWRARGT